MLATAIAALAARFTGFPVVKVMTGAIIALAIACSLLWWRSEENAARAAQYQEQVQSLQVSLADEQRKRRSMAEAVIAKTDDLKRVTAQSQTIQTRLIEQLAMARNEGRQAMAEADALREAERKQAEQEGMAHDEPLFDIRGML